MTDAERVDRDRMLDLMARYCQLGSLLRCGDPDHVGLVAPEMDAVKAEIDAIAAKWSVMTDG